MPIKYVNTFFIVTALLLLIDGPSAHANITSVGKHIPKIGSEVVEQQFAKIVTEISGGRDLVVPASTRELLEKALGEPGLTINRLSVLGKEAPTPLQTAFFARLFDPSDSSHIAQVMDPLLGAMEVAVLNNRSVDDLLVAKLTRLQASFNLAIAKGFLRETPMEQSADFLASLLTHGSEHYPELTTRLANIATKSPKVGSPIFSSQKLLKSPFFGLPDNSELGLFSEAQWVVAKSLEPQLQWVHDFKVLANYWNVMTSTALEPDGMKAALAAIRTALPEEVATAAQKRDLSERLRLTQKSRLFRAIFDLAKSDSVFKREISALLSMKAAREGW